MRASSLLRLAALALVFVLASCGGSKDGTTASPAAPVPNAKYSGTVPVTAVATLDGSGSTASSGGTIVYSWTLTSRPTGSVATIGTPTAVQATLTPDLVGTYAITLTVNDGLQSASVPFTITATAYTPPTILSDLVEPVSGVVMLSLSVAQPTTNTVNWTVDGTALATGASVTWTTTGLADGNHVVVAQIQSTANYVVYVSRTFQTMQSPVSFSQATITESAGLYTANAAPQSVNGILRVDATLDGVAIGSLAARNACTPDTTAAACAANGPNAYAFGGPVTNGAHVVVLTATDGIGRQLGTQLRVTVTDAPS